MNLVQNGAKGCECACHDATKPNGEFIACSSCVAVVCSALLLANWNLKLNPFDQSFEEFFNGVRGGRV